MMKSHCIAFKFDLNTELTAIWFTLCRSIYIKKPKLGKEMEDCVIDEIIKMEEAVFSTVIEENER